MRGMCNGCSFRYTPLFHPHRRNRMITNSQSGTNIQEVADGIFRINTPVSMSGGPGKFNFNQYLIVDDAPMVFHTGQRALFPLVSEAIHAVMPLDKLRYVGLSHFEA